MVFALGDFGYHVGNRDFHPAIAQAERNPRYNGLFRRLLDEGCRIVRLYSQSYDNRLPQQYVDEHERIIVAIVARDQRQDISM